MRANQSDEAVCGMLSTFWQMEQGGAGQSEHCSPQWDGVAACVPSAPVNQLAVLPCIEHYDKQDGRQYFDTNCELLFYRRFLERS